MDFFSTSSWHFLICLIFQVSAKPNLRMEEQIITSGSLKIFQYELTSEEILEFEDEPHPRRFKRSDYDMEHYMSTCQHTFDMFEDKIIRIITPFKGEKQYPGGLDCDWEIIGHPQCLPSVICKTVDIRKGEDLCKMDSVIISDGIKNQKTFCGPNEGFSEPLEPKIGYYMYITFKTGDSTYFDRLYKGLSCEIRCNTSMELPDKKGSLNEEMKIQEEYKRVCGKQFDENSQRIVGGQTAKKNEFPWQAALVLPKTRQPFCGGSLINDRFILTAAHCILEDVKDITSLKKPSELQIILRGHILDILYIDAEDAQVFIPGKDAEDTASNKKEVILDVERIYVHQFYNKFLPHEGDIALVKLKTKLSLTDEQTPTPICLPDIKQYEEEWAGKDATVSGWGMGIEKAKNTARALQKVTVPIIPRDQCNKTLGRLGIEVSPEMLCAGFKDGKKDACQGDSGGPLVIKDGSNWVQIGVVSFGLGCARENTPGIYVNVVRYLAWIRHKTQGAKWARVE